MATDPQGLALPISRQPACQPVLPAVTRATPCYRLLPPSPQAQNAWEVPVSQMAFEFENKTLLMSRPEFFLKQKSLD